MSPTKALRRALSRTADVLWDLALVTQDVTLDMVDQDGLIATLGAKDLLILLDGPDGALGIAAIDREILTGIVEVQTIQQVSQMPVDEDRVLTQTDAAMAAPLLDGTLTRLTENLSGHSLEQQVEGYRFGAMLEDARTTGLLLDAASYRAFRAEMDLALGRRKGTITFFLPERKAKKTKDPEQQTQQGPGPHEDVLGNVPTRLDAILSRIVLPLSKADAMQVGDVIPLAPDALDNVEVAAGRGNIVARGRLGQAHGMRAVRLNWPKAQALPAADTPVAENFAETDEPPQEPVTELPDLSGMSTDFDGMGGGAEDIAMPEIDLPDIDMPAADLGADAMAEDLPDLPPLDFENEAAEFDIGGFDEPFDAGGDLPDISLGDQFGPGGGDFDIK
jgi:flagellar motor switch protein FliM